MKFRWPHRNHAKAIAERQAYLRALPQMEQSGQEIFSWSLGPERLASFQECLTGEMVLPVGVIGPLVIDMGIYERDEAHQLQEIGRHADRVFVPVAHTEGGLSESMLRGMRVIDLAGGVKTWLLQDEMTRDCAFVFSTAAEAVRLARWCAQEESHLKAWINNPDHQDKGAVRAAISRHAQLLRIRTRVVGPVCHVLYGFDTQEACGPNMMTRNAYALNEYIVNALSSEGLVPHQIFLEANLGGDKKPSYEYFAGGHGKTVVAEVVLPDDVVARHLHTTPQGLQMLEWVGLHGAHASGMQSFGFTPASAIAAIFAATGQDLGMVGTSSMAQATVSRTPEGTAFSITLGGIEVGTVGGGTQLPHAQQYLQMMQCQGPGSSKRLAQIIGASALALEISAAASMASRGSENFFRTHWQRGGLR
ncbi:3-hydroxy-3-methylglutaryl-CoA reductase [Sulfobacillus sp. hq2]|uniref:3-hydroxy-3-methylglutaryl-CoA reductase n=1 Tax=Sulfobacillus thermotolerans TaxID=338644 RepID=A0ABM6RN47_9FIRM|nr:3-hydroxy-3-methylglutaryl-CoA reductase [Sulfobacillus sp. hq2]AUW92769.1 3-hydroxy-3-methylglutaryl-CoA reductase [Sulfobacillus thermotolerans]MCY0909540.1 3-hydroxy-3-methylglutaryl-CoA reductase [Sulfobacillus thermotolerans]POB12001.1 3-hydroxy-3-methylglutaryl-CoA reductase [Sulfobacillus sp. hq2]